MRVAPALTTADDTAVVAVQIKVEAWHKYFGIHYVNINPFQRYGRLSAQMNISIYTAGYSTELLKNVYMRDWLGRRHKSNKRGFVTAAPAGSELALLSVPIFGICIYRRSNVEWKNG